MESIKNILSRLREVCEVPNNRQLAFKIGINPNTMSTWIKRESIPYKELVIIAQNKNVSLDWIISGKGMMSLNDAWGCYDLESLAIKKENEKEIKEIISLLRYAPKDFIENIKIRLEDFKEMSKI